MVEANWLRQAGAAEFPTAAFLARARRLAADLKSAGGAGKCSQAVYRDTSDPGYQAVYAMVHEAVERAWQFPCRDLEAVAR
jgi:hypothetical protein